MDRGEESQKPFNNKHNFTKSGSAKGIRYSLFVVGDVLLLSFIASSAKSARGWDASFATGTYELSCGSLPALYFNYPKSTR